ncbi:AsmA-like C-terminal region-containing protein [Rhodopirellula sp. JC639]|uniref:AsmA-like C-terminal region-containing protein n=1 Tax=Stieleria mannarensis TaxID=2755585 RepID=UPI0016036F58|nr:AsmA-like C-terminal region-containing protein [Rhodopirellula sp. JC639]
MVVALLIAAIVFIFRFIAPQTVGEQVRRHVEQTFRDHYPDLQISIGRGRVEPNIGLILDDIRIALPEASGSGVARAGRTFSERLGIATDASRQLVQIGQIVVVASADVSKLWEQENPLVTRRIVVSGVRANAWLDRDGHVSLESLWPLPKFGEVACPRVEVRDAKIVLSNESVDARPIEIDLAQAVILNHVDDGTNLTADDHERNSGDGQSAGLPSTTISINGSAAFAEHFAAQVTTRNGQTDVRAEVRGGKLTGDLIDRLPAMLQAKLRPLRGLELVADTTAIARVRPGEPINFATRSRIHDGRFRHPKSSMPVKQIRGVLSCRPQGAQLESCQAFWGDARIKLDGYTVGYSTPLEAHLDVSAYNVMLDQRLAAVIPERLESGWKKFEPRGLVDVTKAHLDILGDRIETTAEVTCKGVDLNYEKFPYPVRQITGNLTIEDHRVKTQLVSGRVGGQLMQCVFDLPLRPETKQPRVFSAAMAGPIAIDGELLNALSPRGSEVTKLEQFIRSLNPLGAVHLVRGTLRTDAEGVKHQDVELKVSDATLRFDGFPYPLYNVAGDVRVIDDQVTLSGFQGSNANGGLIRCEGDYQIPPREGQAETGPPMMTPPVMPSLVLNFDATRISLDEALRSSLPLPSQQTWDALAPSGVLDSLKIKLVRDAPKGPLKLNVAAHQYDAKRIGSDTLRLQPIALPYRLDIVEAAVRYEGGRVMIDAVRAEHGRSQVSADGGCWRLDDGRWLLSVDVHNGSRLIPDAELINALPQQMRGAMRGLNLRGPVGVSGLTETLLSDDRHPDPVFGWDLQLQLEGNRIGDVGPVHGLRGELSIKGRKDAREIAAEGQVRIDSLHVNDLQITHLRGPFQVRDDRLRLGGIGHDGQFQHPIEGRLFDGTIRMDGDVTLSDASFNVRLALIQAKLPVLLAELGHGNSDLTGTLVGSTNLEGVLGTTDLLRGQGHAVVTDANLYEVPVLMQLLNVLSITPTEDVAFTNADVFFRLSENELYFDDLKLWGSLIALHGKGTLDRRRELDLTFNTRVSPRNTFTRILRPLMDQRYTLWTVDVSGPLDNPSIERRALDGVGQTIERLFQGMNGSPDANRQDRSAGVGRMLQ